MLIYMCVLKCILQPFRGAKEKRKWKGDEADDSKPLAWWSAQTQSYGLALEASASCRCFKMRLAIGKTSRTDFRNWGISCTGIMPSSTIALQISTTSCDSHLTSAAHSPSILSMHVLILSSSADRSHPSGGCRPRSCSSTSIASHTSRFVSCRQRRIWHSFKVQLR
jgi:hypothetical protein